MGDASELFQQLNEDFRDEVLNLIREHPDADLVRARTRTRAHEGCRPPASSLPPTRRALGSRRGSADLSRVQPAADAREPLSARRRRSSSAW